MAKHQDFLIQLDNFRHEVDAAEQYIYTELIVQHAESKSEDLLRALNRSPRFWLTQASASQAAAYICISRIFDITAKYNIYRLLDSAEQNLEIFGREALSMRKHGIDGAEPPWLQAYLDAAHYLEKKDLDRLRNRIIKYQTLHNLIIKPARNKYFAHREMTGPIDVKKLFSGGTIDDLLKIVQFLKLIHKSFWEQYNNGRKLTFRIRHRSVESLYRARIANAPAIVTETKALMQMIESAARGKWASRKSSTDW